MPSLNDRFQERMTGRAERAAPGSPNAAAERFGWSTRDLANRLGVSERTARRYRQQDRVPARKAAEFRQQTRTAAAGRQRARMERRGLDGLTARGEYQVSPGRRFRTRPGYEVRATEAKIPAAAMRDYFAALDAGDPAEADRILNEALADAYGAPGLEMTDVDGLDYTI